MTGRFAHIRQWSYYRGRRQRHLLPMMVFMDEPFHQITQPLEKWGSDLVASLAHDPHIPMLKDAIVTTDDKNVWLSLSLSHEDAERLIEQWDHAETANCELCYDNVDLFHRDTLRMLTIGLTRKDSH